MTIQFYKVTMLILLLVSPLDSSMADVLGDGVELLYADFNDYVPGSSIGQGGPDLGEPVSLGGLDTSVVEISPGENHLLVEHNLATNNALRMRWQFLNDEEVTEGQVLIAFEYTPNTLDNYSILVRENGSVSENFISVTFTTGGNLIANDEAGSIPLSSTTYSAGELIDVTLAFDMDAGTSMMMFNDSVMFSERVHGITERGVGSLFIGDNGFTAGTAAFNLDNLIVTSLQEPDDVIFMNSFD